MASESDDEGQLLTEKVEVRLKYLSTLVAGLTAITLPLLITLAAFGPAMGVEITLETTPDGWFALYTLAVLGSYSYSLDVEMLDKIETVLGNSPQQED